MCGGVAIILDFFEENNQFKNQDDSMAFRFVCNSLSFQIDYEVVDKVKGYFPHIGVTAREGICVLYRVAGDNNWFNINSYANVSPINITMSHFVEKDEQYEIIIFGPIIGKLSKLQVIIPDDAEGSIINPNPNRNMVVAGGFNSFGIGCTTTGCMFSNILERKFNANVSHVTFNTLNYLENVCHYYKKGVPPVVDVGILELDNYTQHESLVEEVLPDVIRFMKLRCKHLIGWYSISDSKDFKKIIANNTIKDFIYNKDLEVLDLSYLHDDEHKEMCTFSDVYINDTGNIMIYKELEECIRRVTKWNI